MSANLSYGPAVSAYTTVVEQLYLSYFGRPADPLGLINFTVRLAELNAPTTLNGINSALHGNAALNALVNSFGTSSESSQLYGNDTGSFVSAIYSNVLNRTPDMAGLQFWVGEINAGRLSKPEAALAIAEGAIALGSTDAAVLNNKTIISTNFTNALDTAWELVCYVGTNAANLARDMLKPVTATTNPATFDFSYVLAIMTAEIQAPYSAPPHAGAGLANATTLPGQEVTVATIVGSHGPHDSLAIQFA